MARFLSKKYPALIVKFSDGSRVQFQQGKVEVDGKQAENLAAFAKARPENQIEQVEGDKEPTRKERLQAEARERGLDDSGTIADLEARLAGAEEGDPDEDPEDDSDEDDSNDE